MPVALFVFIAILQFGCTTASRRAPAQEALPTLPSCAALAETSRIKFVAGEKTCLELNRLRLQLETALAFFEADFGYAEGDFTFNVGAGLRAGYDVKTDMINLAKSKSVMDHGLGSIDVQVHELFHNLVCRRYARFCDAVKSSSRTEELEAIAEATADYFTYFQNQDDCFGEKFYSGKECIRNYVNDFDYSLATGAHMKGAAITAYFLSQTTSTEHLRNFFESGDFTLARLIPAKDHAQFGLGPEGAPAIQLKVQNANLHRDNAIVDLSVSQKVAALTVEPNSRLIAIHPNLRVELLEEKANGQTGPSPGRVKKIETKSGLTFKISSLKRGYKKYFIEIYSGEKLIGRSRIFIRTR